MASLTHSPKPPVSGNPRRRPEIAKPLEMMSMNGGNGDSSYDRMSVVQAYALQILQSFLSEAVHMMSLPPAPSPLRIADLGSATGRNAFAYVDFLVNAIRREYESVWNMAMPELQVYFNDLPGNDFNTMFGLLPPMKDVERPAVQEGDQVGRAEAGAATVREYFAAGVPGSFYGRLFPKESLHFAICVHCLHWISQVGLPIFLSQTAFYIKECITNIQKLLISLRYHSV